MLRTSAVVVVAVVAALIVEDKLHRRSQDQDIAHQIAELKKAQRELSRSAEEQRARTEAQPASWTRQQKASLPERAQPEDKDTTPSAKDDALFAKEEPVRSLEEMRAAIEDVFAAERGDASWSADAQHRAQDGLKRTLPPGSTALSVRCGSSMCRIETRHQDMAEYQRFVDGAFVNPSTALGTGGSFFSVVGTSEKGEVTVVSFLARDGQALPVLSGT